MYIDLLFIAIISAIIIMISLIYLIQKGKLAKVYLVSSLLLFATGITFLVLANTTLEDNELVREVYYYFKIGYLILLFLIFILFGRYVLVKFKEHKLFVNSIKNTQWNAYYVVDKKERIKDISSSLLKELDINRDDCIGEKLFHVFNKSLRFNKLNGIETNNKSLEMYYENYKTRAIKGKNEVEELLFQNHRGDNVALHSSVEPIFTFGKYKGRVLVGEIRTDFDMLSIEKNNNLLKLELNALREKLIGIFETSNEGLFSLDIDERYIWVSGYLVETFGLSDASIDLNTYRSKIEPKDLEKYLAVISNLTINNPFYQVSYRMNVLGNYMWFKEKGKRIFENHSSATIIGTITPLKTKHFMSSEIDNLDSLKGKEELFVLMNKLITEKRYFHLAVFRLNNIPTINEKYGRGIGNLVLSEYVNNIRETFITQSTDCFRIGGIDFAVPITEPRKAELLKRGAANDKEFLNINKTYGSNHFEVEVLAGVSVYPDDRKDCESLYAGALRCVKEAAYESNPNNICYLEDIK